VYATHPVLTCKLVFPPWNSQVVHGKYTEGQPRLRVDSGNWPNNEKVVIIVQLFIYLLAKHNGCTNVELRRKSPPDINPFIQIGSNVQTPDKIPFLFCRQVHNPLHALQTRTYPLMFMHSRLKFLQIKINLKKNVCKNII